MKKRIRIKDIAERAGVSAGTVDRVLHNRGNVSLVAKKKVLDVLEEFNYQRNIIASTLAYNRAIRIAVLLPFPENELFWAQPKAGIDLALEAVQHYGISVEYFHFDDRNSRHFVARSKSILKQDFDAVLLAPIFLAEGQKFLENCHRLSIPYVLINTNIDRNESCYLCYIGQDSYQSGYLAGRLLHPGLQSGDTVFIINLEKKATNANHLIQKEKGFRDFFRQHLSDSILVVRLDFEAFEKPEKLRAFILEQMAAHAHPKGFFVTTSRSYILADVFSGNTNNRPKVVGFDLVEPNLKHLKANHIDFLINQNPFKQGYLGILNLFNRFILKKKVERTQYLPLDIVIKENLPYYLKEGSGLRTIV